MEECLGIYPAQAVSVYSCVTEGMLDHIARGEFGPGNAAVVSRRLQICLPALARLVTGLVTSGRREEAPSDV
jgi:hypothetical protein